MLTLVELTAGASDTDKQKAATSNFGVGSLSLSLIPALCD